MVSETRNAVQIKGIREGLLVTLGEGDWAELETALICQIEEKSAFFQGAKVALDVGNHILKAVDVGSLRDKLSERGITLWALISNSPTTEQTAQVMGMATRIFSPRPERTIKPLSTHLDGESAILLQRTLRSGFRVQYEGHIIVIGDVNPGAEIVAGGSVIVWGRLRGVVQAGADGNVNAVVCAMDLSPTQLRIADKISTSPQRKGKPQPEVARVINGQVIAEPWMMKEGGR